MKKFKVNANLLALLMIISLFAGWEYMIVVTAFIWCFCDASQNLKNLTISAVAIYVGCYVFSLLWSIINGAYGVGVEAIEGLFTIIQSYGADVTEVSLKLNQYLISPAGVIMNLLGSVVSLLILLTKFRFVVSIITNRPMTGAFSKIQEYINYVINFANSNLYEDQPAQQQPQQPMQ